MWLESQKIRSVGEDEEQGHQGNGNGAATAENNPAVPSKVRQRVTM